MDGPQVGSVCWPGFRSVRNSDGSPNTMSWFSRQPPPDAANELGAPGPLQEESREASGWTSVETFAADMRQALRALAGKPGFLCAAVFALALGIASNTVVFSAVNSVLLKPVAFRQLRDPDRLVM